MDALEFLADLLEVILNWRFWLPIFGALGVAYVIHQNVSDVAIRWILIIPVLTVGGVTGWTWDRKER